MRGDKLQEMIYEYKRGQPTFALDWGNYQGYEYLIKSLGRFPTAYVCLTENDMDFGKFYDDIDIECHGGLTYSEPKVSFLDWSDKYKCMVLQSINGWVIGWDYGHHGDYIATPNHTMDFGGKQWRTYEILAEVKSVINQIRR